MTARRRSEPETGDEWIPSEVAHAPGRAPERAQAAFLGPSTGSAHVPCSGNRRGGVVQGVESAPPDRWSDNDARAQATLPLRLGRVMRPARDAGPRAVAPSRGRDPRSRVEPFGGFLGCARVAETLQPGTARRGRSRALPLRIALGPLGRTLPRPPPARHNGVPVETHGPSARDQHPRRRLPVGGR